MRSLTGLTGREIRRTDDNLPIFPHFDPSPTITNQEAYVEDVLDRLPIIVGIDDELEKVDALSVHVQLIEQRSRLIRSD